MQKKNIFLLAAVFAALSIAALSCSTSPASNSNSNNNIGPGQSPSGPLYNTFGASTSMETNQAVWIALVIPGADPTSWKNWEYWGSTGFTNNIVASVQINSAAGNYDVYFIVENKDDGELDNGDYYAEITNLSIISSGQTIDAACLSIWSN
jgi:hypothetical protein